MARVAVKVVSCVVPVLWRGWILRLDHGELPTKYRNAIPNRQLWAPFNEIEPRILVAAHCNFEHLIVTNSFPVLM